MVGRPVNTGTPEHAANLLFISVNPQTGRAEIVVTWSSIKFQLPKGTSHKSIEKQPHCAGKVFLEGNRISLFSSQNSSKVSD